MNPSVKNRNATAYGWSTEIPGDMHAKGHLCEAAFKAHGKGGFHKVVNDVMKRPKLTEEVFRKRKFAEAFVHVVNFTSLWPFGHLDVW